MSDVLDDNQKSRSRGRPKTIDRANVVKVSMESWWRDGTDAVSLNEVCRRAGASKPAVYREFGSEDGLMDAALEHYSQNYLSLMLGVTEQDGVFAEVLNSLIEFIVTPNGDLPAGCLLAKMRVLSSDLGPRARARVQALRAESRATYSRWVERAQAAGELSADIPTDTAAAFLDSQITALLIQVALGEEEATLRDQSNLTFAGLVRPGLPRGDRPVTGDEVANLLGLEPMPVEGGMWAQTWRDEHGGAIYFLMQPGDFSAMHRLDGPELWHHYAGAPVKMLLLEPEGGVSHPMLGDDLGAGQRPFVAVPAGVWMGARTTGDWSLVGTTMAPPFHADGFEIGRRQELTAHYPSVSDEIDDYIHTVTP